MDGVHFDRQWAYREPVAAFVESREVGLFAVRLAAVVFVRQEPSTIGAFCGLSGWEDTFTNSSIAWRSTTTGHFAHSRVDRALDAAWALERMKGEA